MQMTLELAKPLSSSVARQMLKDAFKPVVEKVINHTFVRTNNMHKPTLFHSNNVSRTHTFHTNNVHELTKSYDKVLEYNRDFVKYLDVSSLPSASLPVGMQQPGRRCCRVL
jgi:hypothetical protein